MYAHRLTFGGTYIVDKNKISERLKLIFDGKRGKEGYTCSIIILRLYSIRISNKKRKPFERMDMIQLKGVCVKKIELGNYKNNEECQ